MKTLVIHPADHTTEFLTAIYANLNNKTVIKGGVSKPELREMIAEHDRILMLGHGSPYGLLNPDQFPNAGFYIVDDSMVSALKNKPNNLYIWCFADHFVKRNNLSGLNCGMFISEVREAYSYGFEDVEWDIIEKSNELFSYIVSKHIDEPMGVLYEKLIYKYGLLARSNPVARFNLERINLSYSCTIDKPQKMIINL